MMKPFLTSLGQAKTSPSQRPYFMAFQRPQRPRIVGPTTKFTRCLSMQRHSRRRARCLGDASSTPASAHPRCAPLGTHLSTKRHKATGSALQSRYINVSATTTTSAAPSTPADAPTMTQEKEPDMATTLGAVDATTAARIGVRAPASQDLKPSADTSSTPLSHQGIDHPPTFLNIRVKLTPGSSSKTIGLPVKPVAQMMTTSLFATSHCSWPIRHEHGWSTYRPTPYTVGRI